MNSDKKIQFDDEIDLIKVFSTIWNNKFKIFFTSISAAVIMFFYLINQPAPKISFLATTEIRPISIFDEFEYEGYNIYIGRLNSSYSAMTALDDLKSLSNNKATLSTMIASFDHSSFKRIDRFFLLKLFKDTLNENSILEEGIKEFNLIKKEDYRSAQEYENAVTKLSSTILISDNAKNSKSVIKIKYRIDNKDVWEKFLKSIEKITNSEVQSYLNETFIKLISYQKRLKEYKIEDIEIIKSNIVDDKEYKEELDNLKNNISANKNIERLQNLFSSTPVVKSKKFYAAKIMTESTEYKKQYSNKNYPKVPMLILASILGALIAIFYILISNSIKIRK